MHGGCHEYDSPLLFSIILCRTDLTLENQSVKASTMSCNFTTVDSAPSYHNPLYVDADAAGESIVVQVSGRGLNAGDAIYEDIKPCLYEAPISNHTFKID